MKAVCIWQPRYWDKKVLVATDKVREGKNYVYFCADRNMQDLYSYDGTKVRNECKVCSNGKIYCYEIPLHWLVNEGDLPQELIEVKNAQYNKFKTKMNK